MANDYLVKKWKAWYKSLDVNHDGKISFEDVEESRNKFTELHHLLGDKASSVKVDMEKWWNDYIFSAAPGKKEISETDFVDALTKKWTTDKAAFKAEMQKCFDTIFDVIDTNKDRSIELSEFIFAFKAFGHENEPLVTAAFKKFAKDLVPLKDIVGAWVIFTTGEDKSQQDVVNEAFEEGL